MWGQICISSHYGEGEELNQLDRQKPFCMRPTIEGGGSHHKFCHKEFETFWYTVHYALHILLHAQRNVTNVHSFTLPILTTDYKNIFTFEQSMHFVDKNLPVQISLRDAASLFCLFAVLLRFCFSLRFPTSRYFANSFTNKLFLRVC